MDGDEGGEVVIMMILVLTPIRKGGLRLRSHAGVLFILGGTISTGICVVFKCRRRVGRRLRQPAGKQVGRQTGRLPGL